MSEIDIQVARIMGRPLHDHPRAWLMGGGGFFIKDGVAWHLPGAIGERIAWEPTTKLSDALQVVERMRTDWFSFKAWQPSKMPYNPGDPPLEIAVVSFICGMGPCTRHGTTHHNHHGAYDVEGETLPMAICKAALIALKKA